MKKLLLGDVALPDGTRADVLVDGGVIAAIGAKLSTRGAETFDADGALLAPGFVDGHIHLDKTLLGAPWIPHQPGATIAERIVAEKHIRRACAVPVRDRAQRLAETVMALGTTSLRTHVDIDSEIGLAGLHAVVEVREALGDRLTIQIVAFPQSGVLADPGTEDLLDQALTEGADLVGGLDPASIDGDIEGQLAIVFGIAGRHGAGVDIHLHDPGELGAFQLCRIAAWTKAAGLAGRVVVSHAFALGEVDAAIFGRTAEALASADVAIMTTGPGPVTMPPVKRLRAAGVCVFAGSDNIRDAWSPFGTGDMLERAMLIGYRAGFLTDEDLRLAFDLVTTEPARALGLPADGIAVGAPADLVVLDAASVQTAIVGRPARRLVLKGGRRVG